MQDFSSKRKGVLADVKAEELAKEMPQPLRILCVQSKSYRKAITNSSSFVDEFNFVNPTTAY
jgi:hypothetical protein